MNYIKGAVNEVTDGMSRTGILKALFRFFNHQVISPVTLAIKAASSTLAKHSGTAAALVLVNGVPVKIASATDMPALTGVSIPNGSKQIVGFVVDVNATISVVTGNVATSVGALTFPAVADDQLALGYMLIENGTGAAFTGGTTALDTASLTVTYTNQVDGLAPLTFM